MAIRLIACPRGRVPMATLSSCSPAINCTRGQAERVGASFVYEEAHTVDPLAALELVMNGSRVMPREEEASIRDVFCSLVGDTATSSIVPNSSG